MTKAVDNAQSDPSFEIKTMYDEDVIISEVVSPVTDMVTREVLRLKDRGIRQALIALGWTPPEGMD